eukprot:TRINITY_DN16112_c0_g1_i1.p1 TRINITY_DN16112_c0_g1~~TRINITY_DN16112_c0_g1_i1.p1  ORF type:complete len:366 (+),score=29.97 TRINITY_DN16112_c0_g1_i1:2-1099(+)
MKEALPTKLNSVFEWNTKYVNWKHPFKFKVEIQIPNEFPPEISHFRAWENFVCGASSLGADSAFTLYVRPLLVCGNNNLAGNVRLCKSIETKLNKTSNRLILASSLKFEGPRTDVLKAFKKEYKNIKLYTDKNFSAEVFLIFQFIKFSTQNDPITGLQMIQETLLFETSRSEDLPFRRGRRYRESVDGDDTDQEKEKCIRSIPMDCDMQNIATPVNISCHSGRRFHNLFVGSNPKVSSPHFNCDFRLESGPITYAALQLIVSNELVALKLECSMIVNENLTTWECIKEIVLAPSNERKLYIGFEGNFLDDRAYRVVCITLHETITNKLPFRFVNTTMLPPVSAVPLEQIQPINLENYLIQHVNRH